MKLMSVGFTFRRYKWVYGAVSAIIAGAGWLRSHQVSTYWTAIAAVIGVVPTLFWAWIVGILGSAQVYPGDDIG